MGHILRSIFDHFRKKYICVFFICLIGYFKLDHLIIIHHLSGLLFDFQSCRKCTLLKVTKVKTNKTFFSLPCDIFALIGSWETMHKELEVISQVLSSTTCVFLIWDRPTFRAYKTMPVNLMLALLTFYTITNNFLDDFFRLNFSLAKAI